MKVNIFLMLVTLFALCAYNAYADNLLPHEWSRIVGYISPNDFLQYLHAHHIGE